MRNGIGNIYNKDWQNNKQKNNGMRKSDEP